MPVDENVGFGVQKCISGHLESKRAFQDRTKANITVYTVSAFDFSLLLLCFVV